jgi:hypothetical protein
MKSTISFSTNGRTIEITMFNQEETILKGIKLINKYDFSFSQKKINSRIHGPPSYITSEAETALLDNHRIKKLQGNIV